MTSQNHKHSIKISFDRPIVKQAQAGSGQASIEFAKQVHNSANSNALQQTLGYVPHCLFLDSYYSKFLDNLYSQNPSLKQVSFAEQLTAILKSCNGDSDYYSQGLKKAGWEVSQLILNSEWAQNMWAKEHNLNLTGEALILQQVASIKPDVLYCQDLHMLSEQLLLELKKHCRLLIGQLASSVRTVPIHCYDLIISSLLPLVEFFRSQGLASLYVPLAFEPRLLDKIKHIRTKDLSEFLKRPIDCSFIGSIASQVHVERLELLKHLCEKTSLQVWGAGLESLDSQHIIRSRFQGEAWGQDLFTLLGHSRITVNKLGEVAYGQEPKQNATTHFTNNMRLFEATGMGALLITDYRPNLSEFFEIGKEVVAYRSAKECAALINYYQKHPEKAAEIAAAGQVRTLREHTYTARMQVVSDFLATRLKSKQVVYEQLDLGKISSSYQLAKIEQITKEHLSAWQRKEISERQRSLAATELEAMYQGQEVVPFNALALLLKRIFKKGTSVLEIGCSSGYYYEVLNYLLHDQIDYTGVDYSEAMIKMARSYYPKAKFELADAAKLPFESNSFEIVISGCVLLHCPDYQEQLRETARAAKDFIVLHRTPLSKTKATQHYIKQAYGVETVELRFNELEINELMAELGFEQVLFADLDGDAQAFTQSAVYVRVK